MMDEVAYGEMGECDVCGEWKEEAAASSSGSSSGGNSKRQWMPEDE